MRIVNVNSYDTGGQAYWLSKAINEHYGTKHISRAFVNYLNYIKYPYDILWDERWRNPTQFPKWIQIHWNHADIYHVHNKYKVAARWPSVNKKAGIIMHMHGRNPQINWRKVWASDKAAGVIRVISTLNLFGYIVDKNPDRWFPTPIDVKAMDELKKSRPEKRGLIKIVHSPTSRRLKHTQLLIDTFRELKRKYKNIRLHIIEGKTLEETRKLKADADICFDQLLLQHGTNGLEAMTFRQPTIAGANYNNETLNTIKKITGGIPFYNTSPKTLSENLENLIESKDLREEWGSKGREYIEKWHSFKPVADIAIKNYEEAMKRREKVLG